MTRETVAGDGDHAMFDVKWVDGGREPRVAPNPDYPDGIDVDGSIDGQPACETALPYPATRCGYYMVECRMCGLRAMLTTAGRPDDPRSLKIACRPLGRA